MKCSSRNQYLLDLVISDLDNCISCQVLPLIADHNLVLTSLAIQYEIIGSQSRVVFDYKVANWRDFRRYLSGID